MGHLKADQPMIPKVLIGPAIMIMSSTNPALMQSFAQNASQAAPKPTVQADEGPGVAMFEVCEPSHEGDIYCHNDHGQTMAVAAPGLVAQRILAAQHFFESRLRVLRTLRGSQRHIMPATALHAPSFSGRRRP